MCNLYSGGLPDVGTGFPSSKRTSTPDAVIISQTVRLCDKNMTKISEPINSLEADFGVAKKATIADTMIPPNKEATPKQEMDSPLFNVVLITAGNKKIEVIIAVREFTGIGLNESRNFIHSVPKTIQGRLTAEEAELIKLRFESAGATVEVKPVDAV